MQKDHVALLHTKVRWLSRWAVLTRVLELQEELLLFLKDSNNASFSDFLEDKNWLLKLAYLVLKHYEHQHAGPKRKYSDFHRQTSCIQE
jgi:hypothetical protein